MLSIVASVLQATSQLSGSFALSVNPIGNIIVLTQASKVTTRSTTSVYSILLVHEFHITFIADPCSQMVDSAPLSAKEKACSSLNASRHGPITEALTCILVNKDVRTRNQVNFGALQNSRYTFEITCFRF